MTSWNFKNGSVFLVFISLILLGCKSNKASRFIVLTGETMGTYFRITALTDLEENTLKNRIDSTLIAFNQNLSTYIPTSYISKINSSEDGNVPNPPQQFWVTLSRAAEWFEMSDGYFDPSVMPLVNYWGFGYTPKRAVAQADSMRIDSLMTFVGLDLWQVDFENQQISKSDSRQQLDFSALAKGYGVDVLADLLKSAGISNYLIDIGGEMRALGINNKGTSWVVGINKPIPGADMQDVSLLLKLDNIALATSGNYRNYHEVNGTKYGHTISPKNGFPFQDRLLSVCVAAEKCMDADAIATACMAMGLDKARTFIEKLDDVEACFLAGTNTDTIETIYSNGFIRHTYQ